MSTMEVVMSTKEVAERLHYLFSQKLWMQHLDELFSEDAISIHPPHSGVQPVKGREEMKKKGGEFNTRIEEVHGGWISEPIVGGNFFSIAMGMDATMKGEGRMEMNEIVVYEVKEGKIVKEQFFY